MAGEGGQQGPGRRVQGRVVGTIVGAGHHPQGRGEPAAGIGIMPRIGAGQQVGDRPAQFTGVKDRGWPRGQPQLLMPETLAGFLEKSC